MTIARLCLLPLGLVAFLGLARAQGEEMPAPEPQGTYCDCPTIVRCGKVASSCAAACSGDERAVCSCANPSVLCNANGPYGSFTNSCRCL